MLKNILLTSLRNFFRNRAFSFINLIGLSVSMSLSMLMIMIIKEQLAVDNFHQHEDRIYRVNTTVLDPEWGSIPFAAAPLPLGQVLKEEYAFTEEVVRVNRQLRGDVRNGEKHVPVRSLLVDPSFLTVFHFPLLRGNAATALQAPRSLVLTKQSAEKIFGNNEALGQTLSIGHHGEFTVTGVLEEFAGKTHLDFEVLCSMATLPALEQKGSMPPAINDWNAYYDNYVYIKLKEGNEAAEAEQALAAIVTNYGKGLKSEGRDISYSFYLHPLAEISPGPELSGQMKQGMPAFLLVFLGVLAAIVLLMSVFNFTNLTIAKSLSRAREIGVRKVVGANRYQVFFQLIGEAVLFSLIALVVSYALLQVLKQGFRQLSFNEDFSLTFQEDIALYGVFLLFAVVVGMLAGVLPAAYLSAFKPARVLKDVQHVKVYAGLSFRKLLMVVQFTLSVVFVIVVAVVYRQMDFMLQADYGIDQRNILNLNLQGVAFEKVAADIRSLPGVVRVGGVSHQLGTWQDGSHGYKRTSTDKAVTMRDFMVDDNYLQNIAPVFLAGHSFNEQEEGAIEKHVILNETAVAQFGFAHPIDAIGQSVYVQDTLPLKIIGVVKDFHFRPLTNKIGPLVLRYNVQAIQYLSAKVDPAQVTATLAALPGIWKKHDAIHPLDFKMMEEEIDNAYRETGMKDMLVIVGYSAFLVISLACLGMLGMAMYASQVRAKEVGIRKVMGATAKDVLVLLSKSYMTLMGIALIIGVPLSFMLSQMFLEDFAYKIEVSPLLFVLSSMLIASLGLFTVGSQTIKVAFSNPVKWLRQE